jgi:hypothetical protein
MKTKLLLISIMFALAACTVNVNQPNTNTTASNANAGANVNNTVVEKARWSVVVCSSRAKSVTLSAGANEKDGEVFATWSEESGKRVFNFPARLQNFSSVYFKASASDRNQVELCVRYDGKPKKRVEFDDDEDIIVNSNDSDELDKCRCAE